ncbi:MAG: MFS transporter [Chloroflexi bacterium]|nr:MAG: MFS transporter [Chloroflexota bacterium]
MDGRWRLTAVLLANALLRIANAAGGALVGFYLAWLAVHGRAVDAALLGALGVVANGFELVAAVPFGALTDRLSPRFLLVGAALLGGVATQLFGMTGLVLVFFFSRALEGVAAAAVGPALLAHLADATHADVAARGRVMSYFELTVLAGLALGTLVAGMGWAAVQTLAFSVVAVVYVLAGGLFYWGTAVSFSHTPPHVPGLFEGIKQAISRSILRRLAVPWLAANAVAGLWFTHIVFQLTGPRISGQYLVGRFTAREVGWLSLAYAVLFGAGVVIWGVVLAHISRVRAMRIAFLGMWGTNLCFYLLNRSEGWSWVVRGGVLVVYAVAIMVQSGITPAALAYLVDVAGYGAERGVAMGIYSFLLGLGTVLGAGFGGVLARDLWLDGLLLGSVVLAVLGYWATGLLPQTNVVRGEFSSGEV